MESNERMPQMVKLEKMLRDVLKHEGIDKKLTIVEIIGLVEKLKLDVVYMFQNQPQPAMNLETDMPSDPSAATPATN